MSGHSLIRKLQTICHTILEQLIINGANHAIRSFLFFFGGGTHAIRSITSLYLLVMKPIIFLFAKNDQSCL